MRLIEAPPRGVTFELHLVYLTLALFKPQRHKIPFWNGLEKLVRMSTIAKYLQTCGFYKKAKNSLKRPNVEFYPLLFY